MSHEKKPKFWVDPNNPGPDHWIPFSERENRIDDDYEYCLHNEEVRREYGGQVVAVHARQIWGAGEHHQAAWRAARRKKGCPPEDELTFVPVPEQGTEFLSS